MSPGFVKCFRCLDVLGSSICKRDAWLRMHDPVQELANIDIDICQVPVLHRSLGIQRLKHCVAKDKQEVWNVKTWQEDPVQIFHWSIWGRDISWTPNMAWSLGSVALCLPYSLYLVITFMHVGLFWILERELGGQGGLKNLSRDKATWIKATDGDWEWRCLPGVSQSAIVQAPSLSTKHPKNTTPGGQCCAWLNVNGADSNYDTVKDARIIKHTCIYAYVHAYDVSHVNVYVSRYLFVHMCTAHM